MKMSAFLRFIFLLLGMALISSGCDYFHQDNKIDDINLLDLLIEPRHMPPNWTVANYGLGRAIDPYISSDAAGIVFLSDIYPEALGVGQEVYRFRSTGRARSKYADEVNVFTQPNTFVPSEWKFHSQLANESYISCVNFPNVTICDWLARYERILIKFGGALIPGRFSLIDMEKIVRIIDEKANMLIK